MRVRAPWRLGAALSTVALLAAACGGGDLASAPDGDEPGTADAGAETAPEAGDDGLSADLFGAGASFPNPVYQEWIGEFHSVEPGVSIQYESIGSGGGKEQFIAQQTAFAGSDSVMSDEEIADAVAERGGGEVLHLPMLFGGVVVAFNIDGVEALTLDGDTIAGIFSGEITNVNDPAIAALNEGVDLPDVELVPTVRADSSGTTSIFTTYLEDESTAWADAYGSGSSIEWFDGVVQGEQNDGVAAAVAQQPGGIGYLSLEFAVQQGLDYADVVNADGNVVTASPETVAEAASTVDIPDDYRFDILGVGGDGYPIAGATWVLAYTTGYDEAEAEALKAFLAWGLEEGDDIASELGYAPISGELESDVLDRIERINEEG